MTRVLAVFLAVGLALPARGEESPPPPPAPPAEVVKGRSVELEEGAPAPFKGNLCDAPCKAEALRVRRELEAVAGLRSVELQKSQADAAKAKAERDAAQASKATWGVVLGVGGGALAAGLIAGLILGLQAR